MSRLPVLALTAALALGSISIATEASARGGGGHGGHGSAHGGGHRGGGHFGGFRGGFGGIGFGFYQPYYEVYPYAGCWSWSHVLTNDGWRWRRVDVCNHYPQYFYY
jgi:hypothetical protein